MKLGIADYELLAMPVLNIRAFMPLCSFSTETYLDKYVIGLEALKFNLIIDDLEKFYDKVRFCSSEGDIKISLLQGNKVLNHNIIEYKSLIKTGDYRLDRLFKTIAPITFKFVRWM